MNNLFTVLLLSVCLSNAALPKREGTCGPSNKITYSETILPSSEIDDYQLFFVSSNNQIVFLRTQDSHVYRSDDEGKSWVKQTVPEIMPNLDTTKLVSSIYHTQSKDLQSITLFFLSGGNDGKMWISQDAGVTYKYYNDAPVGTFQLYPHSLYIGLFIARRSLGSTHELWLGDIGTSGIKWSKMLDNVPPYAMISWSNFAKSNPDRIYAMRYADAEHNMYSCQLVYSEDWFKTVHVLSPPNVLNWYHMDPDKFVVVSCSDTRSCSGKTMYISEDGGATFSNPAFPDYRKDTLVESNFYVYEITDDAIWARVERSCNPGSDLCWGDMFHSDAGDKAFSLSLPYQRHWDFTKYASVDGIYVANQYITDGGLPASGDGVRSMITYNKGSQWSPLKPPTVNSKGQPYKNDDGTLCTVETGCSLHIHGWSSPGAFSYFYSIPNAVGLMVASGNVGSRLDERGDKMSFYVSSSGGTSWTEVRQGLYVPEIGDHGSIITIVNSREQTNEVIYNVGDPEDLAQWFSCQFSNETIFARNIRVSEGWDSTRFILYGQKKDATTGSLHAVVYHLNFDKEFSGKCVDSDYERWTPKDLHGNCVMGRSSTYYRRARGKTCYFAEDHEKKVEVTNCECQTEDYECDHCFYRPDLSSDCQLECIVPNIPPPPADSCNNATANTFYSVEMFGYRRIDNDTCDPSRPNAEKPKSKIPCQFTPRPPSTTGGNVTPTPALPSSPWAAAIIILLLIIAVIGVITYLWKYNTSFYNCVRYTFGIDDNRPVESKYQTLEQEGLNEKNENDEDSLDA